MVLEIGVLTDWEEQILLNMEDRHNKDMYGADDLIED